MKARKPFELALALLFNVGDGAWIAPLAETHGNPAVHAVGGKNVDADCLRSIDGAVEGAHPGRFAAEGGWSFVLDRVALLRLVCDGSIRDQLLDPLIQRHLGCQRAFPDYDPRKHLWRDEAIERRSTEEGWITHALPWPGALRGVPTLGYGESVAQALEHRRAGAGRGGGNGPYTAHLVSLLRSARTARHQREHR